MSIYRVETVSRDSDGWWEIRISSPKGAPIPLRQHRPGATREEMQRRAELWCDTRNKDLGLVRRTHGDKDRYRRAQQVRFGI